MHISGYSDLLFYYRQCNQQLKKSLLLSIHQHCVWVWTLIHCKLMLNFLPLPGGAAGQPKTCTQMRKGRLQERRLWHNHIHQWTCKFSMLVNPIEAYIIYAPYTSGNVLGTLWWICTSGKGSRTGRGGQASALGLDSMPASGLGSASATPSQQFCALAYHAIVVTVGSEQSLKTCMVNMCLHERRIVLSEYALHVSQLLGNVEQGIAEQPHDFQGQG